MLKSAYFKLLVWLNQRSLLAIQLLSVGLVISVLFSVSALVYASKAPAFGTVDISGIVNGFVKAQAPLNLPPKALQAKVSAFGQALQASLDNVSAQRHVVLLVQQAVVSGAKDYTADVEAGISAPAKQG